VNGSSKGVVLVCEECGERTVLEGTLSTWRQEGNAFGCECGKLLGPADHIEAPAADGGRRT
jgi:predicted RNA-binding Zn-ribbon protein involved in translation (DUF1610 family)